MDVVALLHPQFHDAPGHFARHAILGYFDLSLNDVLVAGRLEQSYHDDYGDDDCKACYGKQNCAMLICF